jgi:hypothetical protein
MILNPIPFENLRIMVGVPDRDILWNDMEATWNTKILKRPC